MEPLFEVYRDTLVDIFMNPRGYKVISVPSNHSIYVSNINLAPPPTYIYTLNFDLFNLVLEIHLLSHDYIPAVIHSTCLMRRPHPSLPYPRGTPVEFGEDATPTQSGYGSGDPKQELWKRGHLFLIIGLWVC